MATATMIPDGLWREGTTDTTASKYRDPAHLEALVKEFLSNAASGMRVQLIEASTLLRCDAIFKVGQGCQNFELTPAAGTATVFRRRNILEVYKGSELKRRMPALAEAAPHCVALQLSGDAEGSPWIFCFGSAEERGDFYTCLKVFKMMAREPQASIAESPGLEDQHEEAAKEEPPEPTPASVPRFAGPLTARYGPEANDFDTNDEPAVMAAREPRPSMGSVHAATKPPYLTGPDYL